MRQFVQLLHEVGAHEFARQYEWSTWKSQPNCLKRTETAAAPEKGLVAVDFRAGLALLPFLPMSPGDFKLIPQGIWRGSLVQFDRGDLKKLAQFIDAHAELADLKPLLEELQGVERVYRESLFDVTTSPLSEGAERTMRYHALVETLRSSVVPLRTSTFWKLSDSFSPA